jgi:lysophospholipase L1-like esterase
MEATCASSGPGRPRATGDVRHLPYTGAVLLRLHGPGRLPLESILVAIVAVLAFALVRDAPRSPSSGQRPAVTSGPPGAPSAGTASRRHGPPDVAILGDSYTAGANASSPARGFAPRLARLMGWKDAFIRGLPGSGYVARGVTGRSMHALMARTVALRPRLVLLVAGHNDSRADPARVSASALSDLSELRAALPHSRIVVVGPIWQGSDLRPGVAEVRDAIHDAVRQVPRVTWIDPLAERWFTGDRRQRTGNASRLISRDDNHPNDAGHEHIAKLLARDLQRHGVRPRSA